MSFDQWEKKVLQSPGAEERVQKIENELAAASGLKWRKAREWDTELWGWEGDYLIGQVIFYSGDRHWKGFIRHHPVTEPKATAAEACAVVDARWADR